MTDLLKGQNLSLNPGGATGGVAGETGLIGISNQFATQLGTASTDLNAALAGADFTNPGTLLQVQQKVQVFQAGASFAAAIAKAVDETIKGITQKI